MTVLAFDRARLDTLRLGIGAALDDLHRIRCDDSAAAGVMRNIRWATRTLGDLWLPRVQDVVNSTAMTSCVRRKNPDGTDVAEAPGYKSLQYAGMETMEDPWPVLGPPAPHRIRTYQEVLSAIASGAMVPMTAPIDAHGRTGARYDSLSFAPTVKPVLVDVKDATSNFLKVIDFFSDGLPVGWHESQTVSVYYLADARVTSSVHRLDAYLPEEGPTTLVDHTTQATVSGYLIIRSDESVGKLTQAIGPAKDDRDDTKNFVLASQASSSYSGMFFPDEVPDLQPIPPGPRAESPDVWTFTTSGSPMVDDWGTWQR